VISHAGNIRYEPKSQHDDAGSEQERGHITFPDPMRVTIRSGGN
jgi:hypothetical protein